VIAGLKPYPHYQDTGHDWLGSVPAHWSLLRAKRLFREVDERSKTGKEELLSVSHLTGVTPRRLKNVTMFMAESNVGHKVCRPGDLVINTLWAWMAALGVTKHTGIVSPAYGVYRPTESGGILPAYADHILRTPLYAAEYQRRSTGVNSSRLRLYPEQFLRIPVMVPPPDEQAAIVRFLDWANGRLERAIRAKRKVIALLMEQRRAIVGRAVTRGLDPMAPLKATGIPWLGDIPGHWELLRLRQVAGMKPSKSESESDLRKDSLVTFLPMERVSVDGAIDGSEIASARRVWNGFTYFRRGDVIVAKITPCFENGKGAFLDKLPTPVGFGSTEFHVVRPGPKLLGAYLRLITSSAQFLENGENSMTGSAGQQRVPTDFVKNYPIALPTLAEQAEILDVIGHESLKFDMIGTRLKREIELLREYRTRLVADVVTGKFDVREAAAQLADDVVADAGAGADQVDETDDPELIDEEATEA